ncbi:nitrate reductase [Parathalassolituus penaei]|uniref:Molybdopterin-dependent oxidoreductase n=1 Tax=Parathalassolituus penaei TaxID=2997323 RepID=A0A9X3EFH0_9GAMM|nr:nitrate reductase [Parathalassolituus penaei]MCY0966539.1 molybdopterin-dependent oxidoreductase [Parathalassolituus penaei]
MTTVAITQTRTTCPYCGVGCGVAITRQDTDVLPVAGDKHHPSNFGRLCVKGSNLHDTLDLDGRLLYPSVNGERVDWDTALDTVANQLRSVIAEHGPGAVAIYAAGQMLTEDYYAVNKLMKGFIGSGNLDTNSRLCMASAVASYKRAFGSDTVPGCYEDLEQADLLIITGSNAAWAHPILFQRMTAAKKANPDLKVIVVDPRRTATCDLADLHLAIRPGSDAFLFNALLGYMDAQNALDTDFINQHTEGSDELLANIRSQWQGIEAAAAQLDVSAEDLTTCLEWFKARPRTVTFYSQGINQSSSGTDKGNAIINLHLATGRIGKPGACPFSITGQPNAMGGREVGGLANQLAAHMDFADADRDRVQRFWNAPNLVQGPGLKAVDLFNAIKAGDIKFVWIISTNPLVSMPDADDVRAALQACDMVVVSDNMGNTDTALLADVLLPAAGWGEKNGTVTNSERRISRQRGFLPSPGEARADWWIISQIGRRLGYESAFDWQHPAEVFDEYARLTGFENNGSRDLDLSGLAGMSQEKYDRMLPVQWPVNAQYPQGRQRFFEDGRFFTPSGKARFINVTPALPVSRSNDGPLIMNTGRVRDHWHTMTRTAKSSKLAQHIREPYLDIHPQDAERFGIQEGQLARVFNSRGDILVRAHITSDQRTGEVFVPMHWTDRYASKGRMGALIDKTNDPISGQPELKFTGVSVEPFKTRWRGMLLSRVDLGAIPCDYWAYGPTETCHGYELAGNQEPEAMLAWAKSAFPNARWLQMRDPMESHERLVAVENNLIQMVLFLHPHEAFETRQWLLERFRAGELTPAERRFLLAGNPADGVEDQGKTVCSCFSVGEKPIREAIKGGCKTAEELSAKLRCGSNCGSCIPELKNLIRLESAN